MVGRRCRLLMSFQEGREGDRSMKVHTRNGSFKEQLFFQNSARRMEKSIYILLLSIFINFVLSLAKS